MNLFKSGADRAPLEVFDTEQEARSWIAKPREELMGAAARSSGLDTGGSPFSPR
jgi:hypothetical protein